MEDKLERNERDKNRLLVCLEKEKTQMKKRWSQRFSFTLIKTKVWKSWRWKREIKQKLELCMAGTTGRIIELNRVGTKLRYLIFVIAEQQKL
jgi:hypothetical protein